MEAISGIFDAAFWITAAAILALLGHADVATTEIYTHVLDARLQALVLEHHPLSEAATRKSGGNTSSDGQ